MQSRKCLSAVCPSAFSRAGHRPLPESSGARLLASSTDNLLESFSRSAKKATVQERELIVGKAPRSFGDEVNRASGPDSPREDISPGAASEVDRGATLRASTMNEIADGDSPNGKLSPNAAGSPTSPKSDGDGGEGGIGVGGGSASDDQSAVVSELLQAKEAHLARHDVLAMVDLLKAAPLAAAVQIYADVNAIVVRVLLSFLAHKSNEKQTMERFY